MILSLQLTIVFIFTYLRTVYIVSAISEQCVIASVCIFTYLRAGCTSQSLDPAIPGRVTRRARVVVHDLIVEEGRESITLAETCLCGLNDHSIHVHLHFGLIGKAEICNQQQHPSKYM